MKSLYNYNLVYKPMQLHQKDNLVAPLNAMIYGITMAFAFLKLYKFLNIP